MKRYGFVIDTDRCIGCQTCIVGCHIDHKLADGIYWGRLETVGSENTYQPAGKYPKVNMVSRTHMCNHCLQPKCLEVCPTDSISKRTDGIVLIERETCIGCKSCADVCPYDIPQTEEDIEKTSKCNMCYDRVDEGGIPFCVQTCPTGARHFGDLNNKNSDVSKLIKSRKGYVLKPEEKTGPSVYYLNRK